MAGAAGIEPAVTVLETVGLPLTDAPCGGDTPLDYLISLCNVCFLQNLQYLLSSILSLVFFLFFQEV